MSNTFVYNIPFRQIHLLSEDERLPEHICRVLDSTSNLYLFPEDNTSSRPESKIHIQD